MAVLEMDFCLPELLALTVAETAGESKFDGVVVQAEAMTREVNERVERRAHTDGARDDIEGCGKCHRDDTTFLVCSIGDPEVTSLSRNVSLGILKSLGRG